MADVSDASSPCEPTLDSDPRPKRRGLRRALIAGQVLLGLLLGLGAAEYTFAKRDDGAFPHVNFYVSDALLGVRLEPGATMRFRLHDNPVSSISVNAQGYRGADWPDPPAAGERSDAILVVGDSQVFGLGVNDDETASAQLAARTGRPVLNAGVPTYGPLEYLAITQELLQERRPQTVVYVLNFLNDPFELERLNLERHAVWDGWAVRLETAPSRVRAFPGRRWLLSKSHLVYAARRWLHERDQAKQPQTAELGLPSEGSWEDLVADGSRSLAHDESAKLEASESRLHRRKRLEQAVQELESKHDAIDELIIQEYEEVERDEVRIARARPGDIVEDRYSESSRSITLTAAHIRRAASARKAYIKQLSNKRRGGAGPEFKQLVTASDSLSEEIERLRVELVAGQEQPRYPSVFDDHLAQLAELCTRHGAELIVVALPMDVQVSAEEWIKYGVEPSEAPDMEPSLALLGDALASAEALGARGLDATPALREAGPGAFLDGDIHMTATGHAALAGAIAEALARTPPPRHPRPGLAPGHSYPPASTRWTAMDEVAVKGSSKAGCSTQIVGTWLKVVCPKSQARRAPVPSAIELLAGERRETLSVVTNDGLALVTPLVNRQPFTARFEWDTQAYELRVTWAADDQGELRFAAEFTKLEGGGRPPEPSAEAEQLCACHKQLTAQVDCSNPGGDPYNDDPGRCQPSCSELWGQVSAPCFASYAGERLDCEMLLACSQAEPLAAPQCPEGFVNATATNACYRVCDERHPCAQGTCTAYQGGELCFP